MKSLTHESEIFLLTIHLVAIIPIQGSKNQNVLETPKKYTKDHYKKIGL